MGAWYFDHHEERRSMNSEATKLLFRELAFRTFCRHKQGDKPNILLFCSRRGGSTWVLNTLAAHPGMRYVGRPFMTLLQSRWKNQVPSLREAAGYSGDKTLRQIIHFEGEGEKRFKYVAQKIINAEWHIYPTLNFRAPYFHRKTNRVVFQMTSGLPMIKWFEDNFDTKIIYLIRHPIPNALSIMSSGWEPENFEFLNNKFFLSQLSTQQIEMAKKIEASSDLLSRHVLDWCLKHYIPHNHIRSGQADNWTCISYEDLVTKPLVLVDHLAKSMELEHTNEMVNQVELPSRTVSSSTHSQVKNKAYLLTRWREKVNSQQENSLFEILNMFEIDSYKPGHDRSTSELFDVTC